MSRLRIYSDTNPTVLRMHTDPATIATELADRGIRFEQWEAGKALPSDAEQETVLDAYRGDVDRIMAESGFQSVDVIGLTPDHPDRAVFRAKFLEEHTHSEFEIRFFVSGSGLFSLHIGDEVVEVLCEQGDLISVPAGTPHWFDMGPAPSFRAIRFFTGTEGWVAHFTGSDIASRFPRHG